MAEKLDPSQVVTFGRLVVGLLALTVMGIGCSRSYVSQSRSRPTGLAPDHAIAVVLNEDYPEYEEQLVLCVRRALQDHHPTVQVIPPDEFRHVASSDLIPDEISSGRSWRKLAADPAFREHIAPLGLPYLISVSRYTETRSLPCPMCQRVDRVTNLRAEVLDFKSGTVAGSVKILTVGRAYVPFTLALTETQACKELGKAVAKFIAGEDLGGGELAPARPRPQD
ncbi:MAG: hypothetical protein ACE5NA_09210 [Nitrospiraceae bacterium]